MSESTLKAVKEARSRSKKRNFSQSFDVIINVKLLDLKKSENKINEIFRLPKNRGKEVAVAVFSDSMKKAGLKVYSSSDIEKLGANKKELKKLAREVEFFLSEPKLMPTVGKNLGAALAPRGKMPVVMAGDAEQVIEGYKRSVRLKIKDSPVIQCMVGNESTPDEAVSENVDAILGFLEKRLPKGRDNIGKVMVKLTMGKPVKVEAKA